MRGPGHRPGPRVRAPSVERRGEVPADIEADGHRRGTVVVEGLRYHAVEPLQHLGDDPGGHRLPGHQVGLVRVRRGFPGAGEHHEIPGTCRALDRHGTGDRPGELRHVADTGGEVERGGAVCREWLVVDVAHRVDGYERL